MLMTHASQIANVILSDCPDSRYLIWIEIDGGSEEGLNGLQTWVPALPTTCRRGKRRGRMTKSS